MRLPVRRRYSGLRLAQTCWIITSVYFALLIGETTKDALLHSVTLQAVDWPRLTLTLPTLTLFFVSAAEAYLWLNPRRDERLRPIEAGYRGAQLVVYAIAVVLHAFLYQPLKAQPFDLNAVRAWCLAITSLLIVYVLYNGVWAVKRLRQGSKKRSEPFRPDPECPSWDALALYIGHYAFFAAAFAAYAFVGTKRSDRSLTEVAAGAALLFGAFLATYFAIWWPRWHRGALQARHRPLY